MTEKPKIDHAVEEKIDAKIEAAQLPVERIPPEINLPSKTTIEDDLRTRGQRQLNRIWEYTQAIIAMVVTVASVIVSAILVVRGGENDRTFAAFLLLSNAFFLVIGFYFSRTNHARIGDDPNKKSGGSLDDR